jgi:DNA-binding transcriptional regulator YiaG
MTDLKTLRARLGLQVPAMARYLGVPVITMKAWQRGLRAPNAAALRLLDVLCRIETEAPELHSRLLAEASQKPADAEAKK